MPPITGDVVSTFADELTGILQDIAPDWADSVFLPQIISSGLQIVLGSNPITVAVALLLPTIVNLIAGGPTQGDIDDQRERFRAYANRVLNDWRTHGDQNTWFALCLTARSALRRTNTPFLIRTERETEEERRETEEERRQRLAEEGRIDREACQKGADLIGGWNDLDFALSRSAKGWLHFAYGYYMAKNPKYWRLAVNFEQLARLPDVFKHVVWNEYFKMDMMGSPMYDALNKLETLYNTYKLSADTYKKALNAIWDQKWIQAGRGVNLRSVIPVQPELAPWPSARTYYETGLLPNEEHHPEPDRTPKTAALPIAVAAAVIGVAAS